MTRPTVLVLDQSQPSPRGIVTSTGTVFMPGSAQKGPTDQAQLIRNMRDFQTYFGNRITQSLMWDWFETFFREGGQRAYVTRTVGPAAAVATRNLLDASSGTSLVVTAENAGTWGNSLSVAVTQTSGQFQIIVTDATLGQVDQSPLLSDQASAVQWALSSKWVNVALGASTNIPAVAAAAALTGGADDYSGVTDTIRNAALANFPALLGPGQVVMPGIVTTSTRSALRAHARANNRQALHDAVNSASASGIVSDASPSLGDEYGAIFAPWLTAPGVVSGGTLRTVPPTALVAALMARSDGQYSPNVPAAGDNGRARWVVDVAASFTDAERDALDAAGVNVIRSFSGSVTLYGYNTLANPNVDTTWLNLGNQRLRMKIIDELKTVAHTFMFDQIDGRGLKIAEFKGALTGVLLPYFENGSLFGATPAEAFTVDTGSSVNTPDTLNQNQLNAVISTRMSPYAKQIQLTSIKVPVNQPL